MKNSLLIIVAIVLGAVSIFGQGGSTTGPSAKVDPGKPAFTREKFDPTRNPKIDLEKAVVTAAKDGKRIILDVGGEWCGWCIYMDKFFFQNLELAKIRDDNFVWVKVNFSEANENKAFLSPYPEPTGFPHLYVLDETGKLLHSEDTSLLEKGEIYDLAKFTAFLKEWSPKRNTSGY